MLDRYDENLILSYLEGELDAHASAEFEALLAQDEPMRLLVEQLANDRVMLRSVPAHEAPASIMANVQAALERQILLDVRAQGPASSNAPVVYRFRAWHRWAGAIAAIVALGAGLTWHFDPFGWSSQSSTSAPIGEIAANLQNRSGVPTEPIDPSTDADAKSGAIEKATAFAAKPASTTEEPASAAMAAAKTDAVKNAAAADAVALIPPPVVIAAPEAPGASPPGGKGTTALAMAQEPKADLAGGAIENGDAKLEAAPLAAATVASSPAFEIELQTASALDTKQLVLAWADDNHAIEAGRALRRRSATADGAGANQRGNAENHASAGRSQGASFGAETEKDRTAAPAKEVELGGASPAAKPTATQDAAPAPPPAGDELKAAQKDEAPNRDGKMKESAKLAPAAALTEGDAFAADADPSLQTKQKKVTPARQEITLLVPADRIDSLVEHLEAKTGQSLVVVREGDQTLLLSPQVANQRALQQTEEQARKATLEKAEKTPSVAADKFSDTAQDPVAGAPPAPSAVAPVAPAAKKQATKDGKQVLVRIVIVEEAK